eukprot:189847-Chlamydomonas_euryale.AAC.1
MLSGNLHRGRRVITVAANQHQPRRRVHQRLRLVRQQEEGLREAAEAGGAGLAQPARRLAMRGRAVCHGRERCCIEIAQFAYHLQVLP